ncbi:MAG TPA: methyltransferase [Chlamydiales bacterium]|nr:methyltransferase [Chlamydiales bacterium]
MLKARLQTFEISEDQSCHLIDRQRAYLPRFLSVLKFHEPGLAAVKDETGAFHINVNGEPIYPERYIRVFGFYDARAAVQSERGCFHILANGKELYKERYSWCGNFQEKFSVVKDFEGNYFHINRDGKKAYPNLFCYVGDFHDGYATVQNNHGFYTHILPSGAFLHGKWFHDLDVYHKGFARAKNEKGWFHVNTSGESIYPEIYKNIEPFYNGVARVETDRGALHLIDEEGRKVGVLREDLEDPFHSASADLVSYWRFYTIQTAIEIHLFDYLPNSSSEIAESISLSETSTIKLLQALLEMGYVEKRGDRKWFATATGVFFHSQHPFSLKGAASLWKEEHLISWRHLLKSLKTEKAAFDSLYGMGWFDWLENHEDKCQLYHTVLSKYAKRDYQAFCSLIDLSVHRSILDVGGSNGTLLFEILNKNPSLTGLLFDLPNVVNLVQIPDELKDRTKLISGNFFENWPVFSVESAVLSRVIHDWPDRKAIEILEKVHSRLSNHPQNRVYIIENILDEATGSGGVLNLNMLVMTGGYERSLAHFSSLFNQAGFSLETIYPLNQVSSILVARKSP